MQSCNPSPSEGRDPVGPFCHKHLCSDCYTPGYKPPEDLKEKSFFLYVPPVLSEGNVCAVADGAETLGPCLHIGVCAASSVCKAVCTMRNRLSDAQPLGLARY
jgi:hypothetical protein